MNDMDEFSKSEEEIYRQRKDKLEELLQQKNSVLLPSYERTSFIREIREQHKEIETGTHTDIKVRITGRIMNIRSFGKLLFYDLQDESGKIQLLIDNKDITKLSKAVVKNLDVGDIVGCQGDIMSTKKGELSIKIYEIQLLTKAFRSLPEKWHGLKDKETRFRQRYLDFIANPEAKKIISTRSIIIKNIRAFMEDRGFQEFDTPILQPKAGGAIARPFTTHHNALDFDIYLRIAPELYLKRLIIGGFEKVYELGRVFRNEGVDSTHSPEFTMLESYEAYADVEDVMDFTEDMIKNVFSSVGIEDEVSYGDLSIHIDKNWKRREMNELVSEAIGMEINFESDKNNIVKQLQKKEINFEGDSIGTIIFSLFENHVEPNIKEPIFVTGYPIEVSPFARQRNDQGLVTDRFELFMFGFEVANGFSELIDSEEQYRRLSEQAKEKLTGNDEAHVEDDDYVLAMQYGLPPTGGLGVGIDRLVMIATNQQSIREVVPFPLMKPD